MKTIYFIISVLILLSIFGCAAEREVVKTDLAKVATAQAPKIRTEIRNVSHFVVFRSDPSGAEVIVVDSKTGAEAQNLGKTPVKILIMSKKVEIDFNSGKIVNISDVVANIMGLPYGSAKVEGAEFQFKFRLQGCSDEMWIERVSLFSGDSEGRVNINMVPMKK